MTFKLDQTTMLAGSMTGRDPVPWFLMPTLSQDGTYVSGFLVKAEWYQNGIEWVEVTLSPNRERTERWYALVRADTVVALSQIKES